MYNASVVKLQKAGYIFLRERDIRGRNERINYAIMQSKEFGSWTLLETFTTKAARKRRLLELSKEAMILIDTNFEQ
jgi:hypothetical protein